MIHYRAKTIGFRIFPYYQYLILNAQKSRSRYLAPYLKIFLLAALKICLVLL